jgi:putative transposase
VSQFPPLVQEWFTAADLASMSLPGLPATTANVIATAKRQGWAEPSQKGVWWRDRAGRGGGIEYHISTLPRAVQAKLCIAFAQAKLFQEPKGAPTETECHERWAWFERQTEKKKAVARERLQALHAVREMTDAGVPKTQAMQQIAQLQGVAQSSLYSWEKMVHRVHRTDWLPFLAPHHAGQAEPRTELSPEAWAFITADYLRPERPTVSACYRRLERAAAAQGWTVPSEKTLARRLQALSPAMVTLAREGRDALKRMYPAQERSRAALHALEVVNADFHTWDVFVRMPGDVVDRPSMICFQDIYSGKVLAWRIDRNPNKHAVRLAFGDLVEQFGIPAHCVLDNGREFASKWITGGTATRYRFKVKDEEPEGLLVQMGVTVHWATPYAGQSKPIERAFRDMAGDIAKHPAFAGAYVGNKPTAKPENYGAAAVPLDKFLEVIGEEIALHNSRIGRQGGVCAGRSFDQVFNESYARAEIRKASADQRRLWLMAAEALTVGRKDGVIELAGNRYWSEQLHEHLGQKVVARFDPMRLQDDLHVYRPDGVYLGSVPCIAAVGFLDTVAAQTHARDRRTFQNATKAMLKAQQKMSLPEIAAALPKAPEPEVAESRVVRIAWGNTVRQAEAELPEQSETEAAFVAAMRSARPRLVSGDD